MTEIPVLMSYPKIPEVTNLKSGFRIVTDTMPHVESVSLGVWINVGARYEIQAVQGLSHLLEHMVFKGTKHRDAAAIARAIEDVGGHLNAFTSREHTAYYAKILKEDLALAADLLGDLMQNPTFAADELKREQEVIIQEIGQTQDTPDDLIFDCLQATAFPQQPLGQSILGTEDSVSSFTSEVLRNHMAQHYTAPAMALVGCGNLKHSELVTLAEEHFSNLTEKNSSQFSGARYAGGFKYEARKLEQLHLTFGFESCSYYDADYYAFQVLASILGGGMSSRLFQEIREKRGYAYSVYAFNSSLKDTGLFNIYIGTSPQFVKELLPVVADQIQSFLGAIPHDEIARAKAQLKSALCMSMESTSARMEQAGHQLLMFDRPLSLAEQVQKLEKVNEGSLNRVARRLLNSPLSCAGIGEKGALPNYEKIAKHFSV